MLSALLDRRNSYLKWAIGTVTGTAEHMVAKWFGHLMAVGVPDPAAPGVSFFSRHYRDPRLCSYRLSTRSGRSGQYRRYGGAGAG